MVSFDEGHRAVLSALSEYRIAYNELFRFHSLVTALKISDSVESAVSDVTFPMEEEGVWEARAAFMALINSLTNCPHTLEERIVLRDEFSRRGLNEVVAVRRGPNLVPLVWCLDVTSRHSGILNPQIRSSSNWICIQRRNMRTKKIFVSEHGGPCGIAVDNQSKLRNQVSCSMRSCKLLCYSRLEARWRASFGSSILFSKARLIRWYPVRYPWRSWF